MKPELVEAVAIFRELGWEGAPLDKAPDLPIGTPEQQRRARTGLARGEWGHFGAIGPNTVTWVSDVGVDPHALGLFAIRVGVDARRAVELAPTARHLDDEVLLSLPCSARGAAQFAVGVRAAARACASGGARTVELALRPGLRPARRPARAAGAGRGRLPDGLDGRGGVGARRGCRIVPPRPAPPSEADVRRRYLPHVRAAVAAGVVGTGALPGVIAAGVRRGWIERAEALSLAFAALDAAARPSDRKAWSTLTVSGLEATDAELLDQADALVAALATGEAPVVEMFAPRLLGVVPDDLLADVLAAALTARTKKAVRTVLAAAAARRPPAALVEELVAFLEPLVADGDKAVAAAARKVVDAWGAPPVEVVAEAPVATGRWQPTPPLWEVPRFELGEISPGGARRTRLAVLVARQASSGSDRRCRALHRFGDPGGPVPTVDAARRSLRGVPDDLGARA